MSIQNKTKIHSVNFHRLAHLFSHELLESAGTPIYGLCFINVIYMKL